MIRVREVCERRRLISIMPGTPTPGITMDDDVADLLSAQPTNKAKILRTCGDSGSSASYRTASHHDT